MFLNKSFSKKIIVICYFISVLFMLGCSSSVRTSFTAPSVSTETSPNVSSFSPPAWIQGVWLSSPRFDNGRYISRSGFKFTHDDIFLIYLTYVSRNGLGNSEQSAETMNSSDHYSFQYLINNELRRLSCVPTEDDDKIDCVIDSVTISYYLINH